MAFDMLSSSFEAFDSVVNYVGDEELCSDAKDVLSEKFGHASCE